MTTRKIMIMKKVLFITVFLFAFFCLTNANVMAVGDPIIMTEKIDNPIDEHGEFPKSPESTLLIYQSGNTFYFGESYVGCAVTLLFNNVEVYTDIVGNDGTVTIPTNFTGSFELCITIDSHVFSAEIEL